MIAARLQKIFNLYPGEGRMAALVLGYAILLFSANVLAMTASMGLFFGAYDAATLPYTYVLLMFIGPLTSLIYMRINGRLPLSQSLLLIHVALLLSLIVLPLVLNRSQAPLLRFILPVYFEINVILTYTSFWNLLGRIYNLRQGKRLFPFLSSGEHLATIGAGFIGTFFVVRIERTYDSVANLYWIGALCMAGAAALLVAISSANPQLADDPEKASSTGDGATERNGAADAAPPPGLRMLFKEPYVRLFFILVSLYTISVVLVENLSFIEAEVRFPTANGMAAYVGLFMGIYGVLGLLVQWVIAGRALDRFGVSATMLALPGGLLVFIFLFALVGTFDDVTAALFWLAAGANMYAYTVDAPYMAAKNVMLQPLPAHLRTQVQTTTTGIAYPLATGLSGLLLLFLTNVLGFQSVQISYAILVILALWAYVVYRLGRVYVQHLRQALLARDGLRSSIGGPSILLATDRTTILVLEESLRVTGMPNPSATLYALNRLAEVAPEVLSGHLAELLAYPDDCVRTAALDYMAGVSWDKAPPAAARSAIDDLLDSDGAPEVRAAALRAWYAVNFPSAGSPSAGSGSASSGQAGENTLVERLAAYARDPQMAVRRSALAITLSHQEGALLPAQALRWQAWEMLDGLVHSADAADRILAAGVLEEIEKRDRDDYIVIEELLALLGDKDRRVVRAALAGAAHTRSPEVWAAMIPTLGEQSSGSLAINALSAGEEDVLPLLQAACQKMDQDPRIVAGIAQVCGRIGGPDAVDILKSLAAHPDATVRRQALLGLSRCAYQAEAEERAVVKEQFSLSAAALAQISAAQVDIGDAAQVRLTADALEQRREIETDNLLLLLSFLADPQTVLSAREALRLGDDEEEKRAYAIEMLDVLLDHELKSALFPFIQHLEAQERLDALPKQFPQMLLGRRQRLYALVAGEHDRWTRTCAIYGLGLVHDVADEGAEEATAQAASAVLETAVRFNHDPVLVETVLASLENLGVCPESIDDPALGEGVERWRAHDPQAMTLLQKVDALKQAGMLADLSGETLESAASLLRVVTAGAGETIIEMGDAGDCMYVVVDGRLRVHAGERDLDTVEAGDVIGEMALLDAEPRSASVTAVTGSRLLQLDQDPFYDLMALDPRVARALLHLLSARLRERTADAALQKGSEGAQPVQSLTRGYSGRIHYAPYAQEAPGQGELTALEKFLFLRGIEFFSGIDDGLLEQVTLLLEEVDLARGEQLFEQGDAGHSLYIVTAGQVRIHIEGRTLAYAGEGEVIGEMALLESEPRLATVTGSVDSLLLRLDQRPFFELLEVEPDLARGMIRTLAGRLRARLLELAAVVPEAAPLSRARGT